MPVLVLGALAFSDRGIGGTISDRWHDLTQADAVTPQNAARPADRDRERALDLLEPRDRRLGEALASPARAPASFARGPASLPRRAGAGQARARLRAADARRPRPGRPRASACSRSWPGCSPSRDTLALRRGRRRGRRATGRRSGSALPRLRLVAVVFGVHSALDWTWFVPAVAMTGALLRRLGGRPRPARRAAARAARAAGARGRSPIAARAARRCYGAPRWPSRWRWSRSPRSAALAIAQPWRAAGEGRRRAAARRRRATSPRRAQAAERGEGPQPALGRAVLRARRGRGRGAATAARRSTCSSARSSVEPASPEAWRRLGDYYLLLAVRPDRALPVLRGALFLDPLSTRPRQLRSSLRAAGERSLAASARAAAAAARRHAASGPRRAAPRAREQRLAQSGSPPAPRSRDLLEAEVARAARRASARCRSAAPARADRGGARSERSAISAFFSRPCHGTATARRPAGRKHAARLGQQRLRVGDVLEHVEADDRRRRRRRRTAACRRRRRPRSSSSGCAARARSSATREGSTPVTSAPARASSAATRPSPQPRSSTRDGSGPARGRLAHRLEREVAARRDRAAARSGTCAQISSCRSHDVSTCPRRCPDGLTCV